MNVFSLKECLWSVGVRVVRGENKEKGLGVGGLARRYK